MPKRRDNPLDQDIQILHQSGATVQDISEQTGASVEYIESVLNPYKVESQAIELYSKGESIESIKAQLKLPTSRIYSILRTGGVHRRRAPRQMSPKVYKAIEMYYSGVPLHKIHSDTGVSQPLLHHWLRVCGMPTKLEIRRQNKTREEYLDKWKNMELVVK